MKILIIEDDNISLQILVHILEKENYEVSTLNNGRNILQHLEERNVDVLITDIFMPEVDGLEVISIVKKKYPDFPIIAISSDTKNKYQVSYLPVAEAIGADRILEKPIVKDQLLEMIKELK